jgi:hypothetical protein
LSTANHTDLVAGQALFLAERENECLQGLLLCPVDRGTIYVPAGAGIVADSEPEREWDETLSKGRALWLAVQRAEQGQA